MYTFIAFIHNRYYLISLNRQEGLEELYN
jgi:hypothetical protein